MFRSRMANTALHRPINLHTSHLQSPTTLRQHPRVIATMPRMLSTQERTSLVELSSKLELWLNHPARLAPDDWRLLAPILQRLLDLSNRRGAVIP